MEGLYLGIAVTSLNALVAMALIIAFFKAASVGGPYLIVESIGTHSTTNQPTITSAQTAPAVILSFSFVV